LQSSIQRQRHKGDSQPLPILYYGPYTCATNNTQHQREAIINPMHQMKQKQEY
jgi:hypothetical protein